MKVVLSLLAMCLVVGGSLVDEADDRDERHLLYFSTTSITKISTVTISDISTCLSTATSSCNGRRKRLALTYIEDLEEMNAADTPLDSTQLQEDIEVRQLRSADSADEQREGKKWTIWSTAYTTLTVTTTSILPSTTVTASALCLAPNVAKTCFGG
ncbi:uncharacterized protein LOC122250212 [Penaeus japonicus]|uniref:uncharacterized protein LOC122250212 n=1 Tax=Penaeus japonicus TaxID=27405 RepID=UPI001C70F123|nr:uncharacterized protein LOC122250212 [Penaeus japonicus]